MTEGLPKTLIIREHEDPAEVERQAELMRSCLAPVDQLFQDRDTAWGATQGAIRRTIELHLIVPRVVGDVVYYESTSKKRGPNPVLAAEYRVSTKTLIWREGSGDPKADALISAHASLYDPKKGA